MTRVCLASATSASSILASPMSRNRRSLSFSRQRRNSERTIEGVSEGSSSQSGSSRTIAAMMSVTVAPPNSCRPVSIS